MSSATASLPSNRTTSSFAGNRRDYRWTYTDFRALDRALVSDDLGAAQEAFTRLQEDSFPIAEAVSHHPFADDPPHLRALKDLGRALISGDLHGAKHAFQQFQ
jgi:hypothetical protein